MSAKCTRNSLPKFSFVRRTVQNSRKHMCSSFSNSLSHDAFTKFHELFILTCSKQKISSSIQSTTLTHNMNHRRRKCLRKQNIHEKIVLDSSQIRRTISRYSLFVLLVATRLEKTRTDCTSFVHETELHKAKTQSLYRTVQNVPRDFLCS